MEPMHFPWLVLLVLLLSGCPQEPASQAVPKEPAVPAIPADDALADYDKLRLGISSLEIARAYPAPDGKGEGYTRVIEDYDSVENHIIQFEAAGALQRRMILRVYRDQLVKLVDRRDGLTSSAVDAWFAELTSQYGEGYTVVRPGVQWSWGDSAAVLLTFTRDNASEADESANVVIEHRASYEASVEYLRMRKEHASGEGGS
jgi:hypothetical protein